VLDRALKTLPFLYQIYFLKGKDFDRRGGVPSQPETNTPLQIFKEHILTDIGGAAKSVSYI
jgi:hypothetical protein